MARMIATFAVSFYCMLALAASPGVSPAAELDAPAAAAEVGGYPVAEALRLGERMYNDGILPSGGVMKAMVKGDIPVEGRKFTCANCHQRSGFGSAEGWVKTAPIDGTRLFNPLRQFKGAPVVRGKDMAGREDVFRPAYTDETLAASIRTGLDPNGRKLSDTMPVYFLDDRDMAVMVYYLRHLSTGLQPGVTETTLHFATIVTDDIPKQLRDTVLRPLQMYITKWRISRNMERMARIDAYKSEGSAMALRKMSLSVWELHGPPDTWTAQLEELYRNDPVFALLGGLTTGTWEPIHRFCEKNRIPAVFPMTEYPVLAENDWYTLYLSKGLYEEGETAAAYLNREKKLRAKRRIVQVYRRNLPGRALSQSFRDAWTGLGHEPPAAIELDADGPLPDAFWTNLAKQHPRAVVLAWLDDRDFPPSEALAAKRSRPDVLFGSLSLLGKRVFSLPEKARATTYLTYPYTLPDDAGRYEPAVLKQLHASAGNDPALFLGFKMQALRLALIGPLSRMRSFPYRDYFLELLDGSADLSALPVPYPRLSFGQGQRFASKGCYVVQIGPGSDPGLIDRSGWITY